MKKVEEDKRIKLNTILSLVFIFCLYPGEPSYAQKATYNVEPAVFNSSRHDEFSPAYFMNGLVFCTDRSLNLLVSYKSNSDKAPYKMFYVDTTAIGKNQESRLFSKELTTTMNDGPATFNKTGDTVVFSRNLLSGNSYRDSKNARNNLGLFYATFDGEKWGKIRELRINSEWYSVTTPCFSPDGHRLYFASDKQGGYGGADLYYSQLKNGYWSDPINMGPVINTKGNESYPFITAAGYLFFSSDGHPGLGGKDIFFSEPEGDNWLKPVALDKPVNSASDDFGLIADSSMGKGYFSSKRGKSIDIYSFTTNFPQLFYSRAQRINQYCYKFTDSEALVLDSNRFRYEWDFGDGSKSPGTAAEHCFPGPGRYQVRLFVTDRKSGRQVYMKLWKEVEIKNVEQPYIECPEEGLRETDLNFAGLSKFLPGFKVQSYTWDFGDGTRINGSNVTHRYINSGKYDVKLGVRMTDEKSGVLRQVSVIKQISIFNNTNELSRSEVKSGGPSISVPEIGSYDHSFIQTRYSSSDELSKGAIYQVEILTSKDRIRTDSDNYKSLSQKYKLRELHLKDQGVYSYVISDELSFNAAYPVFADAIALGFRSSRIKTTVLNDQPEIELNSLRKVYGSSSTGLFNREIANFRAEAYPYLDQIVSFLNKYPEIKISISAYSDSQKTLAENLTLSQKRAAAILNYIVGRNIKANRISAKGYGRSVFSLQPENEENRKLRNRVLFQVLSE